MDKLSRHIDMVDAVLRIYVDALHPYLPPLALFGVYNNKSRIKRDTSILVEDGSLVGAVTFADRNCATSLDYLVVAPEYRGQGFGSQLLAYVERQAKHPVVMARVFDIGGSHTMSWYAQHGFTEVSRRLGALHPEVIMKKDLYD